MGAPVGWTKAGDATALLIHHDVGALGERGDQGGELAWVLHVAGEQDDAGRRKGTEERGFLGQQGRAGDADNGGAGVGGHGVRLTAGLSIKARRVPAIRVFVRRIAASRRWPG